MVQEQWFSGPVPLAVTDMLTSLQTGMIDAIPATPLAALSFQWYSHIPHMLDAGLGPLIGATVVTRRAWDQIAPEDRTKLLEAAAKAEARLRAEVPKQDQAAIAEMKKRGLMVDVGRLAGRVDRLSERICCDHARRTWYQAIFSMRRCASVPLSANVARPERGPDQTPGPGRGLRRCHRHQAAIAEMKKRGLMVTSVASQDEWIASAREFAATMRGDMVPSDIFDAAMRERAAFRKRSAAGARP